MSPVVSSLTRRVAATRLVVRHDLLRLSILGCLHLAQEAAGLPLALSFAEQKRIFERFRGLFHRCGSGAGARSFNRLPIDAGLIKGL